MIKVPCALSSNITPQEYAPTTVLHWWSWVFSVCVLKASPFFWKTKAAFTHTSSLNLVSLGQKPDFQNSSPCFRHSRAVFSLPWTSSTEDVIAFSATSTLVIDTVYLLILCLQLFWKRQYSCPPSTQISLHKNLRGVLRVQMIQVLLLEFFN